MSAVEAADVAARRASRAATAALVVWTVVVFAMVLLTPLSGWSPVILACALVALTGGLMYVLAWERAARSRRSVLQAQAEWAAYEARMRARGKTP